ncbi:MULTISPECIES: DUF3331 domain-containing protein [unclassified Paraburkholderia]|uniref:DUF3331 domain-containing protein n=1 Tax=unclassified Paraburkholderia TaxID=2615204 RepID=UPI002AB7E34D|nr:MULTISPECIES: DUF3331 domain-containing protein [unclassified Paraburkholderia]
MDPCANDEPWKQTILSLERATRSPADIEAMHQANPTRRREHGRTQQGTTRSASDVPFSGYIRLLERLSSTAVSLCWYDATCGHYADQLWRRTHARRKTVCTVTGMTVNRGDAIYRPYRRGIRPANANHSILACVLESSEGLDMGLAAGRRFELDH